MSREFDLLDGAWYVNDPYPDYAWLRENAPAYWDATNELWGISINNPLPKRRRGSPIQVSRAMRVRADDMPRDPEAERLARELGWDYSLAKRHLDEIRRSTAAIWEN